MSARHVVAIFDLLQMLVQGGKTQRKLGRDSAGGREARKEPAAYQEKKAVLENQSQADDIAELGTWPHTRTTPSRLFFNRVLMLYVRLVVGEYRLHGRTPTQREA